MANYRPLSMLNLNSKVLKCIVSDTIDKHLSKVGSLHPHQWGFKKGQSTETLLLYMTETWKDALDKGYKVGVTFADFKKVFSMIDHEILKFKLQAAGLSGDVHNWLVSYLSNRQQYVDINGTHSTLRIVEIGVPQGSLLAPRLFAIYVNDLPDATPSGYIHMFADDTSMSYIEKDIEQIMDTLNSILKNLYV